MQYCRPTMLRLLLVAVAALVIRSSAAPAPSAAEKTIAGYCNDAKLRASPPNADCGKGSVLGGAYQPDAGRARIPQFDVRDCKTNWDIGFAVGRRFSARIKDLLDDMKQETKWFLSADGQKQLPVLAKLHKDRFSNYFNEICGMAAAVDTSAAQMFMLNIGSELWLYLDSTTSAAAAGPASALSRKVLPSDKSAKKFVPRGGKDGTGCSDVLVGSSPQGPLLGHNEDEDVDLEGYTYMLIGKTAGVTWASLTYAGLIPGLAYGMNSNGLAYTMDYTEPTKRPLVGIASAFLGRQMLEAKDTADAIKKLSIKDAILGGTWNLMDKLTSTSGGKVVNVEVAPGGLVDAFTVASGKWLFHANVLDRIKVVQEPSTSSDKRKQAAAKASLPKSAGDVLKILGDTSGGGFPIYRDIKGDNEGVTTLSTVLFNPKDQSMNVYTGNPQKAKITIRITMNELKTGKVDPNSSLDTPAAATTPGTNVDPFAPPMR